MSAYVKLAAIAVALVVPLGAGCGGGSGESASPYSVTPEEMLQDIAACLERSGAQVTTNLGKLELEAYWGRDRYERGWVGVSTGGSYGDVPIPVALLGGGLRGSDEKAWKACYAKYEE